MQSLDMLTENMELFLVIEMQMLNSEYIFYSHVIKCCTYANCTYRTNQPCTTLPSSVFYKVT